MEFPSQSRRWKNTQSLSRLSTPPLPHVDRDAPDRSHLAEAATTTTLPNVGLHDGPSTEELRECFETKYTDICHALMFIIERMGEVTAALLKTLDLDVKGKA